MGAARPMKVPAPHVPSIAYETEIKASSLPDDPTMLTNSASRVSGISGKLIRSEMGTRERATAGSVSLEHYQNLCRGFWHRCRYSEVSWQALRTVAMLTPGLRATVLQEFPVLLSSRAWSRRKTARGRPMGLPDFVPCSRA
jgi:hypothetical protein